MYNRRGTSSSKSRLITKFIHYATCKLWPLSQIIEEEEEKFIKNDINYALGKEIYMSRIDRKFLVNEKGSNRCFLEDICEDDSDIDIDHNKQMETIHKQTVTAVNQIVKTNPELIKNGLLHRVVGYLEREKEGLINAKICNAVGRSTESRAVVSKFLLDTDMNLSKLHTQYNAEPATISTTPIIKEESLKELKYTVENEEDAQPMAICNEA